MARMTSVFAAVSALVASGAVANAGTVAIMGLTMPTSVAWDEAGRVYVSEKSGLIKVAQNFTSTSATVLLDLRNQASQPVHAARQRPAQRTRNASAPAGLRTDLQAVV